MQQYNHHQQNFNSGYYSNHHQQQQCHQSSTYSPHTPPHSSLPLHSPLQLHSQLSSHHHFGSLHQNHSCSPLPPCPPPPPPSFAPSFPASFLSSSFPPSFASCPPCPPCPPPCLPPPSPPALPLVPLNNSCASVPVAQQSMPINSNAPICINAIIPHNPNSAGMTYTINIHISPDILKHHRILLNIILRPTNQQNYQQNNSIQVHKFVAPSSSSQSFPMASSTPFGHASCPAYTSVAQRSYQIQIASALNYFFIFYFPLMTTTMTMMTTPPP